MAENAALKSRVSDLERELDEALCKLKLGSVGGGAKVVTLALRSEGEGKKDLVSQYLFKEVQLDYKWKYLICCMRDVMLEIEKYLSNII